MKVISIFSAVVSLMTFACGFCSCDKSTDPEPEVEERIYSLELKSSSNAVAGATVSIPLEGRTYSKTTDGSGRCEFHIANSVPLPAFVIALIDHASIMPEAVTFPGEADGRYSRTQTCTAAPSQIYVRDCQLHHLGNDLYDGEPNSQLQLPAGGVGIGYRFYLSALPSTMPTIRLRARGIEHPTEIRINDVTINTLGNSATTGDISIYNFRLSGSVSSRLHVGYNYLTIHTAPYTTYDPWDDIEYCSLMLYQN